jgi:hypothetical protein
VLENAHVSFHEVEQVEPTDPEGDPEESKEFVLALGKPISSVHPSIDSQS